MTWYPLRDPSEWPWGTGERSRCPIAQRARRWAMLIVVQVSLLRAVLRFVDEHQLRRFEVGLSIEPSLAGSP